MDETEKGQKPLFRSRGRSRRFGFISFIYGAFLFFAFAILSVFEVQSVYLVYQGIESSPNFLILGAIRILCIFCFFFGLYLYLQRLNRGQASIQLFYINQIVVRTEFFRTEHPLSANSEFYFPQIFRGFAFFKDRECPLRILPVSNSAMIRKNLTAAGIKCFSTSIILELAVFVAAAPAVYFLFWVLGEIDTRFGEFYFLLSLVFLVSPVFFYMKRYQSHSKTRRFGQMWKIFIPRKFPVVPVMLMFLGLGMFIPVQAVAPKNGAFQKIEVLETLIRKGDFKSARIQIDSVSPSAEKPYFLNLKAWFLTTVPDLSLRDYSEAVRAARAAVRIFPREHNSDTLACALYAAGEKDEGVQIAKKWNLQNRIEEFSEGKLCEDPKMISAANVSEN
jgi:hypothetical protein